MVSQNNTISFNKDSYEEREPHFANSALPAGDQGAQNRLLTVREVAEVLRVPVSWVYERTRVRSSDRLPGYRLGKYWRFREEEILAWVKSHRTGMLGA
jgi:excisionase family DNA binding protein